MCGGGGPGRGEGTGTGVGVVSGTVFWTFAEIRNLAIFPDHLRCQYGKIYSLGEPRIMICELRGDREFKEAPKTQMRKCVTNNKPTKMFQEQVT